MFVWLNLEEHTTSVYSHTLSLLVYTAFRAVLILPFFLSLLSEGPVFCFLPHPISTSSELFYLFLTQDGILCGVSNTECDKPQVSIIALLN